MTDQELSARSALVRSAASLFSGGVMSHSGHANLSARLDGDRLLLTTGGTMRELTEEGLAVVGLDGSVLEGKLDPTNREIVDMHLIVYRLRPEVGAVIHTHSPHLLAFALANCELPCRYEALLRFGQATPVPVVPWAPRGSERSVDGIEEALRQSPDTWAVLLGNHGVLTFGRGPAEATGLVSALEEAAEAEIRARALGGARDLPEGALAAVRASMARARG